jgi:outer membrane protein OmpA-like peptidoglycan-associated protein
MNSAFKKIPLALLSMAVLGVSNKSLAQLSGENLVFNGSFEVIDGKVPKKLDMIKSAKGWYSLTSFQADLFVAEDNIPNSSLTTKSINTYGKEEPKQGDKYAGISVYSPAPDPKKAKLPRNYLATNLTTEMKKGMRYCVKYYVSLSDLSKYSSNNIGAYFTKSDKEILSYAERPIVLIDKSSNFILDNKNESRTISLDYGWEQICGTYVAKGGEKFLVIGNFFSDKETKFEAHKKSLGSDKLETFALLKAAPQPVAAYYYIDDVSVTLLETGEECDCITASLETEYSAAIYHKKVTLSDTMSAAEKIEAHEVHFAITRADLSENGKEALDFIADVMQKNPKLKLLIAGHSDPAEEAIAVEKPDFEGMDDRRAMVVYNYLADKGIDKARLDTERLGVSEESKDADASDDPQLHTIKDLRVTFSVHE